MTDRKHVSGRFRRRHRATERHRQFRTTASGWQDSWSGASRPSYG